MASTSLKAKAALDTHRSYGSAPALRELEIFWRDHYNFLKDRGYTLRPRYHPDWKPSWLGTSKDRWASEDGVPNFDPVMDATRSDGSLVALKKINMADDNREIEVGSLFSSEPLASNPSNHCVPILDVIEPMEGSRWRFMVMPFLFWTEEVPFETIGEAVDFIHQIFEGLRFIHGNNITHGDCKHDNIMADSLGLFKTPPHPMKPSKKRDFSGWMPKPISRTKKPIKYYILDFDLSNVYKPEDAPYLEKPPWGGDKTVPEHLLPGHPPCDPFPVDVYCMGNFVRQFCFGGDFPPKKGFEFIQGLISDMVEDDPKKRPTMSEVVSRFDQIVKGLSSWKLRSPVIIKGEEPGFLRLVSHWARQSYYVAIRLPPIPRYSVKSQT